VKWNDKKSTPDEQTLIEHLLSDEAKTQLLTLVDIPPPSKKYIEEVAICEGGEDCKAPKVAYKQAPDMCGRCEYYEGEYYRSKPNCTSKEVDLFLTSEETSWKYVLEAICKTRGRIVGYIDLIHRFEVLASYDAQLDENWIWKDYKTEVMPYVFVIEAKPKIKVFQQVLRQIKTYKDFIWAGSNQLPLLNSFSEIYFVVATYEELSSTILSAFENEEILVMHVEPPTEGQQRLG